MIILERPVASPFKLKLTSVPQPVGILLPVNEKDINVFPEAWPIRPLAAMSPPEPLEIVAPSTLNWKPPIASKDLYNTDPSSVKCK